MHREPPIPTLAIWCWRFIPLWWHHSRPMTMTSTTSPLCSSTYCSVFGGSIRSPLALRMLISLLLTWFPAAERRENGTKFFKIQNWKYEVKLEMFGFSSMGIPQIGTNGDTKLGHLCSHLQKWSRSGLQCAHCMSKGNCDLIYFPGKGKTCLILTYFKNWFKKIKMSVFFKSKYLCSVPMAEVPGDATSECSGGIQGEGPTLHHMTTRDKTSKIK